MSGAQGVSAAPGKSIRQGFRMHYFLHSCTPLRLHHTLNQSAWGGSRAIWGWGCRLICTLHLGPFFGLWNQAWKALQVCRFR